jgi:hypothetical protein
LKSYAALPEDVVYVVGANRFAQAPLRRVVLG